MQVEETPEQPKPSKLRMRGLKRLSWANLVATLVTIATLIPLINAAYGSIVNYNELREQASITRSKARENAASIEQERADRIAAIEKERADRIASQESSDALLHKISGNVETLLRVVTGRR